MLKIEELIMSVLFKIISATFGGLWKLLKIVFVFGIAFAKGYAEADIDRDLELLP